MPLRSWWPGEIPSFPAFTLLVHARLRPLLIPERLHLLVLFLSAFGLGIAFCAPPGAVTAEAVRRGWRRPFGSTICDRPCAFGAQSCALRQPADCREETPLTPPFVY